MLECFCLSFFLGCIFELLAMLASAVSLHLKSAVNEFSLVQGRGSLLRGLFT